MDAVVLTALCAAAFCAGTVDAIAGGGGLITVPALLHAGLPPQLALGTNKGQSTFGSLSALINFWRMGALDVERAPWAFVMGFGGSLLGARLMLTIPSAWLKPVVLVLLVAVAAVLAFRRNLGDATDTTPVARPLRRVALIALVVGAYDGFFGPGTGTFLIIAWVAWLHDGLARASANAKVVNFASNLAALTLFAMKSVVLWRYALPMAAMQFLGGAFGARLAVRGGNRFVRVVVLLVVAALVAKIARDVLVRA